MKPYWKVVQFNKIDWCSGELRLKSRWYVSFTNCSHCSGGKRPGGHWMGTWMYSRAVLWSKIETCSLVQRAQLSHCIDKAAHVILRICWNEWSESERTWIFSDVTQRISVGGYQHLRWNCCRHLEGTIQYGFTSLKTEEDLVYQTYRTEVRKTNLAMFICIVLGPVSFSCSYNPWCLWLQPEADTQSHTFRCKVFKRPRPCNLCHQPIHHQGSCCRGELGTARYWNASI